MITRTDTALGSIWLASVATAAFHLAVTSVHAVQAKARSAFVPGGGLADFDECIGCGSVVEVRNSNDQNAAHAVVVIITEGVPVFLVFGAVDLNCDAKFGTPEIKQPVTPLGLSGPSQSAWFEKRVNPCFGFTLETRDAIHSLPARHVGVHFGIDWPFDFHGPFLGLSGVEYSKNTQVLSNERRNRAALAHLTQE